MKKRYSLKKDGFFVQVNSWLLPEYTCKQVIDYGLSTGFKEAVVTDNGKNILHPDRVTEVCYLPKESNLANTIQNRIQTLTGIHRNRYEPLQLLKYNPHGEYKAHFDAFPENSRELQKGGNREFTIIIYLNDLSTSGQTMFPKLNVGVQPRCGTSVFFNNITNGKINELSLHCGNPVIEGQKFILTQWVRENSVSGIW